MLTRPWPSRPAPKPTWRRSFAIAAGRTSARWPAPSTASTSARVPWSPGFGGSFLLRGSSAPPGPVGTLDVTVLRAAPNGPAGPWTAFAEARCPLPPAVFTLRSVDPADRDNRFARALSALVRTDRTLILNPLRAVRAYVVEAAPGNPSVLVARVVIAVGPWRPLAAWAVLSRLQNPA